MSSYSYENIKNELYSKGCKLLTSEEELNKIKENTLKKTNIKINYVASCGHNHNVFFNVFKSRGTGIICSSCKNKEIGKNKKEKIINGELTKLNCLEIEFKFIEMLKKLVNNEFDIIKAFDACKVDLIYRPKNIEHDKWVGIQVKTNESIHLTYSFHLHNTLYDNCLIMLFCHEDNTLWIIPENILDKQKKISIGLNKSKYNIYKVDIKNVSQRLLELYNISNKFSFDELNTPKNIYQKREQEFRKCREENIKFIDFVYSDMEGLSYDFKINDLKIQEKVCSIDKNRNKYYILNICKNHLSKNNGKKRGQYDIGDNDFYWINCQDKIYFFVIPEKILIDKGYVGNMNSIISFRVNPENLTGNADWLKPYLFNYQTINQIENKNRLLDLFLLY